MRSWTGSLKQRQKAIRPAIGMKTGEAMFWRSGEQRTSRQVRVPVYGGRNVCNVDAVILVDRESGNKIGHE